MILKTVSAAVLSLSAVSASAAVVAYSNESDFQDAILGYTPLQYEDFESGPSGNVTSVVLPSGIVINSYGTTMTTVPLSSGSTGDFLKTYVDEVYGTTSPAAVYQIWDVAPQSYAFSFIYRGVAESTGSPEQLHVTIDFGGGSSTRFNIYALSEPLRFGFAGFVSDTPFSRILFDGSGGLSTDTYHVDEARTYLSNTPVQPGVVPLPASMPLAFAALAGLGLVGRRRR